MGNASGSGAGGTVAIFGGGKTAGVKMSYMTREARQKIKQIQKSVFNDFDQAARISGIKESEKEYNRLANEFTKKQIQDQIKRLTPVANSTGTSRAEIYDRMSAKISLNAWVNALKRYK